MDARHSATIRKDVSRGLTSSALKRLTPCVMIVAVELEKNLFAEDVRRARHRVGGKAAVSHSLQCGQIWGAKRPPRRGVAAMPSYESAKRLPEGRLAFVSELFERNLLQLRNRLVEESARKMREVRYHGRPAPRIHRRIRDQPPSHLDVKRIDSGAGRRGRSVGCPLAELGCSSPRRGVGTVLREQVEQEVSGGVRVSTQHAVKNVETFGRRSCGAGVPREKDLPEGARRTVGELPAGVEGSQPHKCYGGFRKVLRRPRQCFESPENPSVLLRRQDCAEHGVVARDAAIDRRKNRIRRCLGKDWQVGLDRHPTFLRRNRSADLPNDPF